MYFFTRQPYDLAVSPGHGGGRYEKFRFRRSWSGGFLCIQRCVLHTLFNHCRCVALIASEFLDMALCGHFFFTASNITSAIFFLRFIKTSYCTARVCRALRSGTEAVKPILFFCGQKRLIILATFAARVPSANVVMKTTISDKASYESV